MIIMIGAHTSGGKFNFTVSKKIPCVDVGIEIG
jgi:hypothetical protein